MKIVETIVGILAICALVGYLFLRLSKSAERFERDERYRRRTVRAVAFVWISYCLFEVILVLVGEQSILSLIGFPVVLGWLWIASRSIRAGKQRSD